MFQYMEIQKSPWFKHGDFWISVFQYIEIQKSPCIETWRFCKQNCSYFWISMFQYMEIQKSPCIKHINFLIFKNICVLKHGDSRTSVFYTRRFFFKKEITRWNRNRWWKYFRVWIRGLGRYLLPIYEKNRVQKSHATVPLNLRDFWISMYWYTEIQKSPCFGTQAIKFCLRKF